MMTTPNRPTVPADAPLRDRSSKRRATRSVVDLVADVRALTQDTEDVVAQRDQALRVLAATVAAYRIGWAAPELYAVALLTRTGLMPEPGADPHEVLTGLAHPTVADLARFYPDDRHEGGLRRELLLAADVYAPGRARTMLVGAVADWCLPGVAEDAATVVSELVTNVVRHAHSAAVSVAVALGADATKLVIEVGDEDPAEPRLLPLPSSEAVRASGTSAGEGGAGLVIVRALAAEVDVRRSEAGKVVAASLLLPGGAR